MIEIGGRRGLILPRRCADSTAVSSRSRTLPAARHALAPRSGAPPVLPRPRPPADPVRPAAADLAHAVAADPAPAVVPRPGRRRRLAAALAMLVALGLADLLLHGSPAVLVLGIAPVLVTAARSGPVPATLVALGAAAAVSPALAAVGGAVGAWRTSPVAAWLAAAVLSLMSAQLVGRMSARARRADGEIDRLRRAHAQSAQAAEAAREELDHRLRHRDAHDPLTDLLNRQSFLATLAGALTAPAAGRTCAVLVVDLDQFKAVNDGLGHRVGDELLRAVAGRLLRALRHTARDGDALARLGADEFALLINHVRAEQAASVAGRLLSVLAAPFAFDSATVTVRPSAGLVVADRDSGLPAEEQALELLRQADVAMSEVKAGGRGGLAVFREQMQQSILDRLTLESDLARAVAEQEFVVYYQPLVDLRTGSVAAVEALVRWQHPRRGLVPPDEFIPVAERSGAIVPIGLYVLQESCRQLRAWQHEFPTLRLQLAVNLSARQLDSPDLVSDVAGVLYRSGLDPRQVVLELTESLLMADDESALTTLWQLRGLGLRLAVDDFGTGYSSLSRLGSLPIDEMKIDRSFVAALGTETGGPIVTASVAMAHGLGLTTVAEGVESAEQLAVLAGVGCDLAQGYHFSRAVPAAEMPALLGRRFDTTARALPPRPQRPEVPLVIPPLGR
jgi:diguanylate cyclase (GGDEF)-like protein